MPIPTGEGHGEQFRRRLTRACALYLSYSYLGWCGCNASLPNLIYLFLITATQRWLHSAYCCLQYLRASAPQKQSAHPPRRWDGTPTTRTIASPPKTRSRPAHKVWWIEVLLILGTILRPSIAAGTREIGTRRAGSNGMKRYSHRAAKLWASICMDWALGLGSTLERAISSVGARICLRVWVGV
jgi:hypothetical protein